MKRMVLIVVAAACLLSLSGAAIAKVTVEAQAKTSLSCTAGKLVATGGLAKVIGAGCTLNGKKLASVVSVNSALTTDGMGSTAAPCGAQKTTGITSLHYQPAGAYSVSVVVRVHPRSKNYKVTVSKRILAAPNTGSRDVCEYQPPVTTVGAGTQDYCSWTSAPVWNGKSFRIGGIACPVDWGCKWVLDSPQPKTLYGFRFWGNGRVRCSAKEPGVNQGYFAYPIPLVYLSQDKVTGCAGTFEDVTTVPLGPNWNGNVFLALKLWTVKPNGTHDGSEYQHPEGAPLGDGNYHKWNPLSNTGVNPCETGGYNFDPWP